MQEQQTATPPDAAKPDAQSLDDRISAKFGLDEPEQPQEPEAETPSAEQPEGEPEITIPEDEVPQEPVGEFELKHNGELKKVPVAEAQRLAQMGYDYEFKMQRVQQDAQRVQAMAQAAQARAAIQAQALDAMAEAKSYERQLQAYANVNWTQEAESDPVGAFQKRMQHDQLMQAWQYASQQVQQLQQPLNQAQTQLDEHQLAIEANRLADRIPEWKRDPALKGKEVPEIFKAITEHYGFSPEELLGAASTNHKFLWAMRDLWKYRQAVSGSKARKGQLQGLPQTAKPGAKPAPRSQAQSVGDVKRALRQTTDSGAKRALTDELIARKFGIK